MNRRWPWPWFLSAECLNETHILILLCLSWHVRQRSVVPYRPTVRTMTRSCCFFLLVWSPPYLTINSAGLGGKRRFLSLHFWSNVDQSFMGAFQDRFLYQMNNPTICRMSVTKPILKGNCVISHAVTTSIFCQNFFTARPTNARKKLVTRPLRKSQLAHFCKDICGIKL